MKFRVVMAIVLCALGACHVKDTESRTEWPRTTEPRLSGAQWRDAREIPPRYRPRETCETVVGTHQDAIRVLTHDLRCIDSAIERLARMGQWSDLAAAYFIRARADGQPVDYLLALEAADRAVQANPLNPAAQFNRGLIQETTGLHELAMQSYASLRFGKSEWAEEARQRHAALRERSSAALPLQDSSPRNRELAAAIQNVQITQDLAALASYEKQAHDKNDPALVAKCAWIRGWILGRNSDLLRSLDEYASAARQYAALRDPRNAAACRFRHAGVLTVLGQAERAWEELLQIDQRDLDSKERQAYIGEIAAAARSLGHPAVALQFRELVVTRLRNEIRGTPPGEIERFEGLRQRLAYALRSLAEAELEVNRFASANAHLRDAMRYKKETVPSIQRLLDARMAEVNAKRLAQQTPEAAVAEFTHALELTGPAARSARARILLERAAVQRQVGNESAFVKDLSAALDVIHEEETAILATDDGSGEAIWSDYFSRFEDTYALLIGQLAPRDPAAALAHAERARGFEPLHRLKRLPNAPREFLRIAQNPQFSEFRALLPPGTFLLEYSVLDDRTYTWVIWRDGIRLIPQETPKSSVVRWTSQILHAASRDDWAGFDTRLFAPYDGLIDRPLAFVRRIQPRGDVRLVIIPDRSMQGLPFAALRNSRTNRHLMEDATIEVQGSALLYIFSLLRDEEMPFDRSMLLIGNPAFDPSLPDASGLKDLAYAEGEVQAIREEYGDGELLTRKDATIQEFLRRSRDKAIVHIAAHAVVNPRRPHLSAVLLARTSDRDRGALDVQQLIRGAKLDRTRVVVLSACSSAGGAPVGPEGVAPLVRPILTAGVPAVLGTLWPINDATAKDVLVSFHRHFHEGRDAAVALRDAQRELLGKQTKTIEWAPYEVIGHATSPYGAPKGKDPHEFSRPHSVQRADRTRSQ